MSVRSRKWNWNKECEGYEAEGSIRVCNRSSSSICAERQI